MIEAWPGGRFGSPLRLSAVARRLLWELFLMTGPRICLLALASFATSACTVLPPQFGAGSAVRTASITEPLLTSSASPVSRETRSDAVLGQEAFVESCAACHAS